MKNNYTRIVSVILALLILVPISVFSISAAAPTSHKISNVGYLDQSELPTGCETVSAVMLLNHYGFKITSKQFANNYLIKKPLYYDSYGNLWAPDPNSAFVGDPSYSWCYGIFAPGMAKSMNNYLKAVGSKYEAVSLKGKELSELCHTYIDNDIPVMVWATMYMDASYKTTKWYVSYSDENSKLKVGDVFQWTAGEHCLLLVGYDENYYYFHDPLTKANQAYRKSLAETRYEELGKTAVILETQSSLEINSKDTEGNVLSGAEFTISDAKTGNTVEVLTTNSQGYAVTKGGKDKPSLDSGSYKITCTKCPDGYLVNGTNEWTYNIGSKNRGNFVLNVSYVLNNGYIVVEMYDKNGNPIDGSEFSVIDENGVEVAQIGPTVDGYAISDGGADKPSIPYGTYTVRLVVLGESKTPIIATPDNATPDEEMSFLGKEWTVSVSNENNGIGRVDATYRLIVGDVDFSGDINVKDGTLIQRSLAKLCTLKRDQTLVADVTGDGKIDVRDATYIQKWLADIPVESKIGEVIE